jgi:hypothetical protein
MVASLILHIVNIWTVASLILYIVHIGTVASLVLYIVNIGTVASSDYMATFKANMTTVVSCAVIHLNIVTEYR